MSEKGDTQYTGITWEKCNLRNWLNNDFFMSAFNVKEQSAILMIDVNNSKSQGYSGWSTDGGNNTQDQIFLLSYAEANQYLCVMSYDTKSRVVPTSYAKAKGAYTSKGNKTTDGSAAGWWWLRSPGDDQYDAALVLDGGSLNYLYVDDDRVSVRPALWLSLESDIF